MAKNKTLELSIKIAGKVDKSLTAAINQSSTMLGSLTTTMSRLGTVGLASMGALTAATVAGLAKCTDEAAKLENNMSAMVRYVDGLTESATTSTEQAQSNLKAMRTYIQDLSTQIPRTTEQISKMSAALGQSGKGFEEQLSSGILRDAAVAATAMDLDDQTAGDYMAKWEASFNFDHQQVMELMDQINYLGANSATTAAEIAGAVNEAASLGQIAGADAATTAALADAMLATGVASGRVGNAIKRTYTNLSLGQSATKAQAAMWQELGFTATGVAKAMQTDSVGTLRKVFGAINDMPDERKMAALKTLFGQWAIEGDAKVVNNLGVFEKALDMVSDPAGYTGSMEREFLIQAGTPEAVDMMLANSKAALMQDVGEAFLPVKKQFGLMMTGLFNDVRHNMPEIETLGESLAAVLAGGVTKLGDALQYALPYIQKGLDYLANNGQAAANVLKIMAGTFAAMKFAPGIETLLGGAGNLLFGTKTTTAWGATETKGGLVSGLANLFAGGQRAGGLAANIAGEVGRNGLWTSLVAAKNTFFNTRGKGLATRASGLWSYFGNVKSSAGAFGKSLGLDKAGGFLGGAFKDIFSTLGGSIAGTPQAQAVMGAGSFLKNGALGLAGKASGVVSGIAGSGFGQAVGKAGGFVGSLASSAAGPAGKILSSGAGALGSIWGPLASGFGSLFAGAVPVAGAISAIIAVVSILGDHLDGIRNIVGNVFGEPGLAVFNTFTGKLGEVGSFISSLFVDGGVAQALSGVRENIVRLFGPEAGAAFDGLTAILQSVMSVAGQLVNFATGTVKPIIQEIFGFITGTAVPILLQTFTSAAPYIAGIISGLGSAVMAGMQVIGTAIQFAMPIVKGIISVIMSVGSVAIPALLAGISVFSQGAASVMEAIKTIFGGLTGFIKGVFTMDWEKAWQGVLDIFGGIFKGLEALVKTPVNAVAGVINALFDKLRGISFDIPDWSPIGAGKSLGFGWLPTLPTFAKGGFTDGASIAGEAGREAVISFQSGVRARNIDTWMQAGRLLGVTAEQAANAAGLRTIGLMNAGNPVELKDIDRDGGNGGPEGWNITYAPQITIQGNADREVIDEALREAQARFETWFEQMMRRKKRVDY